MSGRGLIPTAPANHPLLEGAVALSLPPAANDGALCVTGSRAKCGGGWLILVTVRGEDGSFTQVALTTEEARRQAKDLIDMADVLEGNIW